MCSKRDFNLDMLVNYNTTNNNKYLNLTMAYSRTNLSSIDRLSKISNTPTQHIIHNI